METRIIRSLEIAEKAPQGFALQAERIVTVSSKSSSIKRWQDNLSGKLSSVDEITHGLKNPGGLTWTGSDFLISDNAKKVIYKIDTTKKVQRPYVDLVKLKTNAFTPILKAKGTRISAIASNQGKLWITVQAGYSSSVLVIDDQTKELVNTFYTRGPEPVGIAFEAEGKSGWVLDGSNKELSQFDTSRGQLVKTGIWTQTVHKVPLKKPLGLAIDNKGNFLTADLATNKIYLLGIGGES